MLLKYWKMFDVGLQNTFVYRWNFLLRSLFGLLPLAGTVFIWRAIFSESSKAIGGYDYASMIWYFLLALLVDNLITPTEDEWQIASDIREGQINSFLVKPINYLGYRVSLYLSYRAIYTVVTILPVTLVFLVFRDYVTLPTHAITWFYSALSLGMAAAISFLITYSVAMMAFWLLEISTLVFIVYSFEYFLSGHTFPLDIMPAWFQEVLRFVPFPYQMFFPIQVFTEKVQGAALYEGLCIQAVWVVLMWMVARFLWSRGVRKFQAYGG